MGFSQLYCLRYDSPIVFRRQNHTSIIFRKTMWHDLLVQMAYCFGCLVPSGRSSFSVIPDIKVIPVILVIPGIPFAPCISCSSPSLDHSQSVPVIWPSRSSQNHSHFSHPSHFSFCHCNRPILRYWNLYSAARLGEIKQKKSPWGSAMNNTFLLFYSPKPCSQVWMLTCQKW